jgi:hypothetical protein
MNPDGVVGIVACGVFALIIIVILALLDIFAAPKKEEWKLSKLERVRWQCYVCRQVIPDDGLVYARPGSVIHATCFEKRDEHARR